MKLLISGGTVVNPAGRSGDLDILIEDGVITAMWNRNNISEMEIDDIDEEIHADGLIVSPGLVDTHVHFRDPGFTYKEDIYTGARAAIKGGFTSVVMMGNTDPPISDVKTLEYVLDKGAKTEIHVYSCANVTISMRGKKLTPMEDLLAAGAVGFSDDGKPITDKGLMRKALKLAAKLDVPISVHEEYPTCVKTPGFNRGVASEYFEIGGADRKAETTMIKRDIELAHETGATVVIQHISTAEGVELVRQAKADGISIHAEATPHHFSLTETDAIKYSTLAKMNPPVRTEEDRQAIIAGLLDGTIDIIATDHAPHTMKEKMEGIVKAPSGIIGLETALGLAITELVRPGRLTLEQLVARMSATPAEVYNLDAGVIELGAPADITIFDPNSSYWVEDNFASKSNNSPFVGWKLYGKVKYTIVSGKVCYRDM